jgi:hypothetical protein
MISAIPSARSPERAFDAIKSEMDLAAPGIGKTVKHCLDQEGENLSHVTDADAMAEHHFDLTEVTSAARVSAANQSREDLAQVVKTFLVNVKRDAKRLIPRIGAKLGRLRVWSSPMVAPTDSPPSNVFDIRFKDGGRNHAAVEADRRGLIHLMNGYANLVEYRFKSLSDDQCYRPRTVDGTGLRFVSVAFANSRRGLNCTLGTAFDLSSFKNKNPNTDGHAEMVMNNISVNRVLPEMIAFLGVPSSRYNQNRPEIRGLQEHDNDHAFANAVATRVGKLIAPNVADPKLVLTCFIDYIVPRKP